MKVMKTVLVCLMALLSPAVYAQENAVNAGTTPDSFLYGLDVALDKISLLLTFDQAEKSRKALEIARERLLEVREMAVENKLDAMERAQKEHDGALEEAASSLAKLEKVNSTEEIEAEIEIEKELKEHKKRIEEVRGEVEIRIKVKGEITPEQRALLDDVLTRLTNTTGKVEIEIENKRERTKIKIKRETGRSEEEIEREIEELEEEKGLTAVEREEAREKIEDAREEIAEVTAILGANASKPTLLIQAEKHLEDAEIAFNESNYGKASGLARAAEEIAEELKERLEEAGEKEAEEEKLEIKAEIKKDKTEVEVEHGDRELEFTLNTTNRAEIVSAVAERIGLPRGDIEAVIRFKEDGEHRQAFVVDNKTARMEKERKEREEEREEEEELKEKRREEKRRGEERD